MVGVWRDLCGSSNPTPLLKQGHLQQAAQDLVQAGLEYLQRGRLHNIPGQPVPMLRHPQREEVLPHVQMELPVLQFVPISPCPVAGHHRKEFGPILLTPTLQIFIGIYKGPLQPSLLQAEQAQLPQPFLIAEMLQSPNHLCSPEHARVSHSLQKKQIWMIFTCLFPYFPFFSGYAGKGTINVLQSSGDLAFPSSVRAVS